MSAADTARAGKTRKRTRIQEANEERILDAALEVFSTYGFRGVTVDQIATVARMTKPNLLYYFQRKQDIYLAVLQRTLQMWLQPLEALGADGDPAAEIGAYTWQADGEAHPAFRLRWQERGGPKVALPIRRGFGTRLIERGLSAETAGRTEIAYEPEGVVCILSAELQ